MTFDAYNSRRPEFPTQRVTLLRQGISPTYAAQGIGTVFVSRDGSIVNTTGKVGHDGYYYPERENVTIRASRARPKG